MARLLGFSARTRRRIYIVVRASSAKGKAAEVWMTDTYPLIARDGGIKPGIRNEYPVGDVTNGSLVGRMTSN